MSSMPRRGRRALLCALACVAHLVLVAASSSATEGPRIELDRAEVEVGAPMIVRMYGFKGAAVTVAVCGNLAKRGSADCNMAASTTEGVDQARGVTIEQLSVYPPPTHCPCIIRATNVSGDEFAVAPFVLKGHPLGRVVGPAEAPLVRVSVQARRATKGVIPWVRSSLGGPTRYAVEVSVRNLTTETLSNVRLAGSGGGGLRDHVVGLELPRPEPIEPGRTWRHAVKATMPAPAVGEVAWQVTAHGAGPNVVGRASADQVPMGLWLLAVVFGADLLAITWRRLAGRRRAHVESPALDRDPSTRSGR